MKTQKLLRKIHYWGSLLIMLQFGVMVSSGILLMLKKQSDWIQPPTQVGSETNDVPVKTFNELFMAVKSIEQTDITKFQDFSRVDIKPNKGIAKFVTKDNWEIQVDTHTAKILSVNRRRSDVIESIHDGSFFSEPVKRYVFLPTGIVLFFMWLTGVYLFFLPRIKKWLKRRT